MLEIVCDIPFIFINLFNESLPLLDYIWMFVSINIDPLFGFLTLVAKSELEPSLGSRFRHCGLNPKRRE